MPLDGGAVSAFAAIGVNTQQRAQKKIKFSR